MTVNRERVAMVCILLFLVGMLSALAMVTGVTVDEPAHLLSGYLYWHGQDRLQPGDMPPLIKIASGWVPYLLALPLPPPDHPDWKTNHEWNISLAMMFRLSKEQIQKYFGFSRLPMIVFPAGCCILLWLWARELFSPAAGVLAAMVFALSPTVLAHGALIKNDLAAAFGFLLFWYCAWRYWRNPGWKAAAWLGIAMLIAVMAKFSLLILAPITPLVIAGGVLCSGKTPRLNILRHGVLITIILYAGICISWRSPMGPVARQDIARWRGNAGIPRSLVSIVRVASHIPTPTRFWTGAMSLVESNSGSGGTYLRGKVVEGGDPTYFLTALAVKVPLALQILVLTGLAMSIVHLATRRLQLRDMFWIAPPILYLGLASLSSLQHGVRLVLPALVLFILIAAHGMQRMMQLAATRAVLAFLFAWLGWRTLSTYPHYISFFNRLAGGADNGIVMLSDSNLDWGQDMPRLADFVRANRIEKLRLSYFGADPPHQHIDERVIDSVAPPWSESLVKGPRLHPEPGYYAISATLLTGQLFAREYRDYYSDFRKLKPVAKAGYSIFIYRIPAPGGEETSGNASVH